MMQGRLIESLAVISISIGRATLACRDACQNRSVGGLCLRDLEMRRRELGSGSKTSIKYMNICSSLLVKVMIHFPYGYTVSCAQSRLSADSVLEFPPSPPDQGGTPPPRIYTVSIHLPIYRVSLHIFKILRRQLACKPQSYQRLPVYCPFRPENYAFCPKKSFSCPKTDNVGQCTNEKLAIARPIAAR